MTADDLAWGSVTPRRCRRHVWAGTEQRDPDAGWIEFVWRCVRCGKAKDEAVSRRGRTNRSRGNAIERWACQQLGITRVGMYGSAEDGGRHDEPWVAQVKSGGYFTERYWTELKRLTATANQTAILVVTDTPGPGHRRRAYVVMDLEDFRALHVGTEEAA